MSKYPGSCHCGAVRFEIESDLPDPARCNCSICVRRGVVMVYVEPDDFTLVQGGDVLVHYRFRSDALVAHSFCKTCGVFPFYLSTWQGVRKYVVNVGCLEGVDPYALSSRIGDGASF